MALLARDGFANASGTLLQAHATEDLTWTKHPSSATDLQTVATAFSRLRAAANATAIYFCSLATGTEQEARLLFTVASDLGFLGLYLRMDRVADTGYFCSYNQAAGGITITRRVAAVSTTLTGGVQSWVPTVGATYELRASVSGVGATVTCVLSVLQNGAVIHTITRTDTAAERLVDVGRVGIRYAPNGTPSDSVGCHPERFEVHNAAAEPLPVNDGQTVRLAHWYNWDNNNTTNGFDAAELKPTLDGGIWISGGRNSAQSATLAAIVAAAYTDMKVILYTYLDEFECGNQDTDVTSAIDTTTAVTEVNQTMESAADRATYAFVDADIVRNNSTNERAYQPWGSRRYMKLSHWSPRWDSYLKDKLPAQIATYGPDGIFGDVVHTKISLVNTSLSNGDGSGTDTNIPWVNGEKAKMLDDSGSIVTVEDVKHLAGIQRRLLKTREAIGPSKIVGINVDGIETGLAFDWSFLFRYADLIMDEAAYFGHVDNPADSTVGGAAPRNSFDQARWERNVVMHEAALRAGVSVITKISLWHDGLAYPGDMNIQLNKDSFRAAFATYLLTDHRGMKGSRFYFAAKAIGKYSEFWIFPQYATAHGTPTGRRYQYGSKYRRNYTNGYVEVDWSNLQGANVPNGQFYSYADVAQWAT